MRFMLMVKRSFRRGAVRSVGLTAAGTLLIAATYGMARFGVGLLHPAMAAERPDVAGALPAAGAAQFGSYCLAAVVAALLVPARSRAVAGAAGLVAAAGCLGLAYSTSAGWFVVSAFVAGAGAGLASPALVGLVDALVPARASSAAQAVVNSGTAVGVVAAGVLAGLVTAPRVAWPVMAAVCLAAAAAVVLLATGERVVPAAAPVRATPEWRRLTPPLVGALAAGVVSAAVWTYGPTSVVSRGLLEPGDVGLLWTALGLGGLAGALVRGPVTRWGPARSFLLCTTALVAGSLLVLAPGPEGRWWPLAGAAIFGGAYMAMSGVLILWGRLLDARRGAAITAWLFLALAVGQAVGSHVLGPVLA